MTQQTIGTQRSIPWELGLFAASVSGLTIDETIALVKEHGYSTIEWRVQTQADIDASPWGPARNTLALERVAQGARRVAAGASRENLTTCGLQIDISRPTEDAMRQIVGAAADLGCPRLRVEAPIYDAQRGYAELRNAFVQELDAWTRIAGAANMQVCVETHFGTIAPSASLSVALLAGREPAAVGIMWDPANTVWEGSEDAALALDQMGPYLAEVHLKNGGWWRDAEKGWQFSFCALSEGILDWARIFPLLEVAGYAGPLVLEDYRPVEPAVKLLLARSYLHELDERMKGGTHNV